MAWWQRWDQNFGVVASEPGLIVWCGCSGGIKTRTVWCGDTGRIRTRTDFVAWWQRWDQNQDCVVW